MDAKFDEAYEKTGKYFFSVIFNFIQYRKGIQRRVPSPFYVQRSKPKTLI